MIKKKKILIVQGSLRIGGCTTILRNYLKIFAKQEDYDVTLLLEEAPRNENIPENIKVHHLLSHIEYEFGNISRILISRNIDENKKDYFNSWINEIEYSKEKRLLDFINSTPSINKHYDIIIDFNSSFSNFLQKYDLHPDIKVIQWIHIYDQITRMLQSPKQSRYIFNKFSGFVCIADEMVEYQEQAIQQLNLDKKPITMIYNPFDLENAALKRDELSSEQDQELMKEPYLLSVAGLYNYKNHRAMIRIYHKLKQKGLKEKLYIIGGGGEEGALRQLIWELGLENDCLLLGMRDNPFPFMKNAQLFIHTSWAEGLPTVFMESMACGTPVVAYGCRSGVKDVLGNGKYGCIVPFGENEEENFAETVYQLVHNDQRKQEFIDLFPEALERFSFNVIEPQLRHMIQSISS